MEKKSVSAFRGWRVIVIRHVSLGTIHELVYYVLNIYIINDQDKRDRNPKNRL